MIDAETLERLEIKIAYLERANSELSDVVYRQQQTITALQDEVALLKERMEVLREWSVSADDNPPH
jgi:SlyX protein